MLVDSIVAQAIFQMAVRLPAIVGQKPTPKGQLAILKSYPHKIIFLSQFQKATISRPVLSEFSSEPV